MSNKLIQLSEIISEHGSYVNNIKLIEVKGVLKIEISDFQNSNFINIIDFIRNHISNNELIHVIGQVEIYNQILKEKIDLSCCIFYEKLIFQNCRFEKNVTLNNCQFKQLVCFRYSHFKSKSRFQHSEFNSLADFNNAIFENLVDFYESIFKNTQQFLFTDFLGVAIFSRVKFKKQTQFLFNKVSSNSIISFESAEFNQAIDISRANFWCKLNFWGAEIDWNPIEMGLYKTDDINNVSSKQHEKSLKRLRESCRIIKNEFTKENNKIEALEYHKSEMALYLKELKSKKKKEERIPLWFNMASNYFGTSWIRGLKFTLLATLFFYILFLLSLSHYLAFDCSGTAISATIKHFVEFLNITNWSIKPFGIENYNWAYLVLFIGRIFIGYGYYQTIQAFRKYGKN